MSKQIWKPSVLLNPVPVVMVTCSDGVDNNVFTVAWAGTINSKPPMLSISVRKSRYSYEMITKTGEFVVNLVTEELAFAADYCGVKSGRDIDKFKEAKLNIKSASVVKVPILEKSPVNIECKVEKIIELGTHDMFIASVVACQVDDNLINSEGKLSLEKAGLICYSHGEYWGLSKSLGYFGYSVKKKDNKNITKR